MQTRSEVMVWAEKNLATEKIKSMRIAVAGLVFNSQGKILLLYRGDDSMDAVGCLEGIGGSLENSEEELKPALMREIKEEIANLDNNRESKACSFSIDRFLVCSHLEFQNRDKKVTDWIVVTFLCQHLSGKPAVGEIGKADGIGWFDLADFESWIPGEKRQVSLMDYYGNSIKQTADLSIWVPTVLNEYKKIYGEKPWPASGHEE